MMESRSGFKFIFVKKTFFLQKYGLRRSPQKTQTTKGSTNQYKLYKNHNTKGQSFAWLSYFVVVFEVCFVAHTVKES